MCGSYKGQAHDPTLHYFHTDKTRMIFKFNPMPGLTLAVLICLPILIGLGIWQYQRWHWKTDILTEIDAAVTAPPLSGLDALAALPPDTPVDFRRITVTGRAMGPTWYVYRPDGSISWQPFREVQSGGTRRLVGFPTIDDQVKATAPPPELDGVRAGYVRRVRDAGQMARWFGATDNPESNRWFSINPDGQWREGQTIYIDLDPTKTEADALPVRRPDIPNNHVSYMLTWWSFAGILLLIYGLIHVRAGRLTWR
jgi:surfeit locus 1 family protein